MEKVATSFWIELHGVVDGHAGGHRAAGGVDVEVDVALGVFGGQQQQLLDDRVGVLVARPRPEGDDPLAQQPLVHAVVEAVEGRRGRSSAGPAGSTSGASNCVMGVTCPLGPCPWSRTTPTSRSLRTLTRPTARPSGGAAVFAHGAGGRRTSAADVPRGRIRRARPRSMASSSRVLSRRRRRRCPLVGLERLVSKRSAAVQLLQVHRPTRGVGDRGVLEHQSERLATTHLAHHQPHGSRLRDLLGEVVGGQAGPVCAPHEVVGELRTARPTGLRRRRWRRARTAA